MGEMIVQIIIGLALIVIGALNMKGNISLLHSYHTKRVKEEDILPFGKKVGTGTTIIGIAVIAAGILSILNFAVISTVIMGVGMAIGLVIIFHAMFKYNKGIF